MSFCYKTAAVWLILGKLFFILKIVVPLIIIIIASIDFGKAVTSSDEKELQKSVKKLILKIIAGVVIFFIPTLIRLGFFMMSQFSDEMKKDADNCINCLTSPYSNCDTSYKGEIFN